MRLQKRKGRVEKPLKESRKNDQKKAQKDYVKRGGKKVISLVSLKAATVLTAIEGEWGKRQ